MNKLFSLTVWIIVGVCILPFMLMTVGQVLISPPAFAIGVGLVIANLVIMLPLLSKTPLWPDFKTGRYQLDGKKRGGQGATWMWVLMSLGWGGIAAISLVMVPSVLVFGLVNKLGWDMFIASFGGAYPEEIVKTVGVAFILFSFRQLNRPWHGLLTGAIVGLGFEIVENALYGVSFSRMDPNSDIAGALDIWMQRTFIGPLLHTVFTAVAGYGLGLALFYAKKTLLWRWTVALSWFFLAFALHFSWNILVEDTTLDIIKTVVVSIAMYVSVGYAFVRSWRDARADRSYTYSPYPIVNVQQLAALRRSDTARS